MRRLLAGLLFLSCVNCSNNSEKDYSKKGKVYICKSATAHVYHRTNICWGLNECTHPIILVKEEEGISRYNRRRCKICY